MLGGLRGVGALNLTSTKDLLSAGVREELRILVALATLLVRDHEVVTVVELPETGNVKTIACARSDSINDQPESSTQLDVTRSQPVSTEINDRPESSPDNTQLDVTRSQPVSTQSI